MPHVGKGSSLLRNHFLPFLSVLLYLEWWVWQTERIRDWSPSVITGIQCRISRARGHSLSLQPKSIWPKPWSLSLLWMFAFTPVHKYSYNYLFFSLRKPTTPGQGLFILFGSQLTLHFYSALVNLRKWWEDCTPIAELARVIRYTHTVLVFLIKKKVMLSEFVDLLAPEYALGTQKYKEILN